MLDLGSGAGFDCFLAARGVGPSGRVIGVDMTPQMLDKARQNAIQGGYSNVEFRLGEIENLPVADNHVDMVISNCVINLSPDKERVFSEAFRVIKPGGRLIISDIVLLKDLPAALLNSVAAYVGCVSGAALRQDYLAMVGSAGFRDVEILAEDSFDLDCMLNAPQAQAIITEADITPDRVKSMASVVRSIKLQAFKPSL